MRLKRLHRSVALFDAEVSTRMVKFVVLGHGKRVAMHLDALQLLKLKLLDCPVVKMCTVVCLEFLVKLAL